MASYNRADLDFILAQIRIAEAHAAGEKLVDTLPNGQVPWGLRTVDGSWNNIDVSTYGSSDHVFPRMLPAEFKPAEANTSYAQKSGLVFDSQPRTISNLIVDQTDNNPAATAAANGTPGSQTVISPGLDGQFNTPDDVAVNFIPNVSADVGLTAPFNSWMTYFGQFFDHGLDLVAKGGNGTIFIPLQPDDPLYVPGSPTNFMVLSRATMQPGLDGVVGTADDVHEQVNNTSPFVDQNQTYSSHPSHQVFLREYQLVDGKPVATGRLIENRDLGLDGKFGTADDVMLGGMATWKVIKAQARDVLGIELDDTDVLRVPLLATDPYGNFLPGSNGLPQLVTPGGLLQGNLAAPVDASSAFGSGHAFLDDIAHNAVPMSGNTVLLADADNVAGGVVAAGRYDNELLDAHYVAGDGRVNENIGLTTVHHVFHSEHNRLAEHTKGVVLQSGDLAFLAEWLMPGTVPDSFPLSQVEIDGLHWNGERLFQAARFGTEMQYQHLVFEEFARTVQPQVDGFLAPNGYDRTIDPSIVAEFAHTVYRFGHSMLTETIDRLDPNFNSSEIGLIAAFLNPLEFAASGDNARESAGAIVRGLVRQVGNEIDEFVTEALRNSLLGLPLDLPALNIARGRDVGVPSLNAARREFYEITGDSQLKPYTSWADMVQYLKHPESLVNFIAAYGTHDSITDAVTMADKRAAATLLVLGGAGEPADRLDFLHSTGDWASASNGVTSTGLDAVDFWIGGLAEEKMPFGGMLGSTFNFVFETQLEDLQNGDRFYYLARTAGLHFGTELENNSFAKLVMLNTDVTHLNNVIFQTPSYTLEVDQSHQYNAGLGHADPTHANLLTPLVSRDNPLTPGADTNFLRYTGEDHVVLGGTAGHDIIISGDGDDTLYGDDGDDRLEGGYGNDAILGGAGDDIIQDMGGDDRLEGGAGNDVIQGGNMMVGGVGNLILGGDGKDFIITTEDISTTFGGQGDDFILGAKTNLPATGNEGNDWIEFGTQDGAPGDNFSPLLNDDVKGHDIFIGGGGFDEMIGEGGDDIFVGSDAQDKMDGMSGFDWITYKNEDRGVTADLALPTLAQPHGNTPNTNTGAVVGGGAAGLLDRFAEVEGLSGSAHADILRGDDVDAATILTHGAALGGALTDVSLIDGLQNLLGAGATGFATGNIILGGDGSDFIEGRGGDDLIDGDKWLNVRISVRQNKDGSGPEIRSVDSMVELIPDMIAGRINPGQLVAMREIKDGNGGFDTAIYTGARADYTVQVDTRGTLSTADDIVTVTDSVAGRDGSDRLTHIERLQFADQSMTLAAGNNNPVGVLQILDAASNLADATPATGQTLKVSIAGVTDADNAGGGITGPVSYTWQVELVPGSGEFSDIALAGGVEGVLTANGASFTVTPDVAGLALRVKAIYQDAQGVSEMAFSQPTAAVAASAAPPAAPVTAPVDVAPGGAGIQFVRSDLAFILDQIRIAEAHAAGADLASLLPNERAAMGLRTVDGSYNNLQHPNFGAADHAFPRVTPPVLGQAENTPTGFGPPGTTSYQQTSGNVFDSQPRVISNLIVDQTNNNPAAVAAAAGTDGSHMVTSPGLDGVFGTGDDKQVNFIPNQAPDAGLSAPFNAWMTFFGQFFDHGLDLVAKGGNGTVFIPLKPDDPLYVPGSPTNFMVLTRATMQPGADGVLGTADDVHEQLNTTSPFVDQNQTYSSHPSHQVFLRAYEVVNGVPKATGELIVNRDLGLDGKYGTADDTVLGGMATWKVVKAQARDVLGIDLTDEFVGRVPLLATDPYGNFIPGPNGRPQVVMKGVDGIGNTADDILVEGNPAAPVSLANALFIGHGFLEDIAHDAVPVLVGGLLAADGDSIPGLSQPGRYDNELLDAHYIAGDGRVNENIGLTAVHHVFHAEHSRLVEQTKQIVLQSGDLAFLKEWLLPGTAPESFPVTPAAVDDLVWNGERLFQTAKFGTEMQYQHLVFEEFARTVQPNVDLFFAPTQVYDVNLDASIVAEFAHTVYRFGHSMLTETIDRVDANGNSNEIGLIAAFLNPLEFAAGGTAEEAAGAIVRGVTRQVGNEIDEFVTDALRSNLLGLPLDLAAINMARSRDVGVPSLNAVRRSIYDETGDSQLKPYTSWADMVQYLKHPESIINFIAAYGTHGSILSATTTAAKRAAAMDLVFGGSGAPADRLDFINSTGAWASNANGVTSTGLDKVDLWIGGLAEEKMPFGGMLGSTFNFIFENQLEKLQDGDRFYYLERTAGLSFNAELESNSFAKLIMANTTATHLPGLVFSAQGFTFEVDQARQYNPGLGSDDPVGDDPLQPLVSRDNPATAGADSNYLKYSGDQHVVLGGSAGGDILIASEGDDTIWGDDGDDTIDGGYGNDQLRGGAGDDIITDLSGDDNIQGGDGNDVIQGGNGINLIIGGMGNDFIITGEDGSEAIGGHGNDFILGGKANEQDMGNEGDDWIEGGTSDGAPGDNFDPLALDTVIGNDVFIGRGENDKFNAEGGDDIMVGSVGMGDRYIGGSGYDWASFKDDAQGVSIDLAGRFFDQPQVPGSGASVLTRMDAVEGLSGSSQADILVGDDADANAIAAAGAQGSVLTNIALIDGLQEFLGANISRFDAGNIILGGAGSDIIEGRGGDDVIDGDKWLNVRISVRANANGTGAEIKSVDSMVDLVSDMLAGTYKVGQLVIVREIRDSAGPDFDTAVFSGNRSEYAINVDTRGTVDTSDDVVSVVDSVVGRDGSDRLTHIERLQFADTEQVLVTGLNAAPVGAPTINISAPSVGQRITASIAGVTDADNIGAGNASGAVNSTVAWYWQAETVAGAGDFTDILVLQAGEESRVTGPSFTVTADVAGLALRVRAVYKDAHGVLEQVHSGATAAVNNPPVGTVSISDTTPTEGQALVASAALSDADGIASPLAFQWQVGNGLAFTNITGATAASFTPQQAQVNQQLRVVTTYTDANGRLETAFSTPTTVVGDLVIGTGASETINGTAGQDNLQGRNGNDLINALAGNDLLLGEGGNDTLAGGLGADSMVGGIGNDTYDVDNAGDIVTEAAGEGTDTVHSSLAAYALAANVENLVITGGAASVTGNNLANLVTSGAGNDTMAGGAGNDIYVVNQAGDVVVEGAGQGTDMVRTSLASWTLAANVENLQYTGGATSFNGIGNGTANTIWGGEGNDLLDGGASGDRLVGNGGNDVLIGGTGADTMEGGAGDDHYAVDLAADVVTELAGGGTDTVQVSLSSYTLGANVENLVFTGSGNFTGTGNGLANSIIGGGGADSINGGAGADTMTGGAGNDFYTVDNIGDVVVELAGEGADQISTALSSWTLGSFIENLRYTGLGNFTGMGNTTSNTIWGNNGSDFLWGGASADRLFGNGGNDTLEGGTGNDTMDGGTGNDHFLFGAGFGNDIIAAFDANPVGGQDRLDIAGLGITAASFGGAVAITQVGVDTRVQIGSNSITLLGMDDAEITMNDFLLAP
ncbi:MAG: heme peroxidase [Paucimonas sp.]|nr:heme peroxidase [Paucimonas sp.]